MFLTAKLTRRKGQKLLRATRSLTVFSWGRNAEGQAGVEGGDIIVARPTAIMELHDTQLSSLDASKMASAAVTTCGDVMTWGEGRGGRLGQGSAASMHTPTRVESLVGRAHVVQAAMGDHHTLLLDDQGGVWACGENKEGQCGLGTPLEVIAQQHRRSFYESVTPRPSDSARPHAHASHAHPGATHPTAAAAGSGGAVGSAGAGRGTGVGAAFSRHIKALLDEHAANNPHPSTARFPGGMGAGVGVQGQQGWGHQGASWHQHGMDGQPSSEAISSTMRMALGFGGMDMESLAGQSGLQPGQHHTPMRIGRDLHPLAEMHMDAPQGGLRMVRPSGLEAETVVGLSASRYFSLAATAGGDVWTWGACYNGALGSDSSWSTSAQQVSGALASAIAEHGGAVQVAAGATFAAALTSTGKVVVWGTLPSSSEQGSLGMSSLLQPTSTSFATTTQPATKRVMVGVVPGLPPITMIAAGVQHLVMSDGERVWVVGRTANASGAEEVLAPWTHPQEVLAVPEGVSAVEAGAHASGVVTHDGDLYLWGRLLDFTHAESLLKRYGLIGGGTRRGARGTPRLSEMVLPDDVRWRWAGFGGAAPRKVDGLPGRVRAVALGGWHALAALE